MTTFSFDVMYTFDILPTLFSDHTLLTKENNKNFCHRKGGLTRPNSSLMDKIVSNNGYGWK